MRLYSKCAKFSHLCLRYVEESEHIVKNAHTSRLSHCGVRATHDQITKMGWLVGARAHGLPQPYIEKFVSTCVECSLSRTTIQIPNSSNNPVQK